jgi:raffinose/stachyose/melibiose transport system permease protein
MLQGFLKYKGVMDMVLKDKKYAILFLSPALILITVFLLNPLIQTFYYSLTDWRNFSLKRPFIGLENYTRLFHDPVVLIALKNTLMLIILSIIVEVGFGLVIALLLNELKKGFKIFRTIYFLPVVISGSAIGLMFYLSYQYNYGLLNNIIVAMGFEKKVWLTEHSSALLTQIPYLWQNVGFYVVILLTAMSKIPADIYESASLDGVTGIKRAFYVTIPLIWSDTVTAVALVITSATKVFDIVYTISGGGPLDSSQLLSTYMYQSAFSSDNQGYGSAIAVTMIILGVFLTALTRLLNRKETLTY